jgi:hypothetical protein
MRGLDGKPQRRRDLGPAQFLKDSAKLRKPRSFLLSTDHLYKCIRKITEFVTDDPRSHNVSGLGPAGKRQMDAVPALPQPPSRARGEVEPAIFETIREQLRPVAGAVSRGGQTVSDTMP